MAPGTAWRAAIVARSPRIGARARAAPPGRGGCGAQSAAARRAPTSAGPATTSHIELRRRGLRARSSPGNRRAISGRRGGRTPARRAPRRGGRRTRPSRSAAGSPASATTFHVVRRGSSRRKMLRAGRDVVGDRRGGGESGRRRRAAARRARARRGAGGAQAARSGSANEPVARLLLDARRSAPSRGEPVADPRRGLGARRPRRDGRSIVLEALDDGAQVGRGPEALAQQPSGAAGRVRPCPARQPTPTACSARSSPARCPPRSCARTSGRSRSWTSTRRTRGHLLVIPRAHARRPARGAAPRTSPPARAAAQELAGRRHRTPGRRRRQPDQLVRARRVADRVPLPRARHPALRRRSAAPAVDAGARRPRRDRRRGGGADRPAD